MFGVVAVVVVVYSKKDETSTNQIALYTSITLNMHENTYHDLPTQIFLHNRKINQSPKNLSRIQKKSTISPQSSSSLFKFVNLKLKSIMQSS